MAGTMRICKVFLCISGFAVLQDASSFSSSNMVVGRGHLVHKNRLVVSAAPVQVPFGVSSNLNLYSSYFQASVDESPIISDRSTHSIYNNRHSSSDWLYNIKTLPKSSVLKEIRGPVVAVAAWSTVVSLFRSVLLRADSGLANQIATRMCVSTTAHGFLVSALGLLLVFRTNSAYQRFNEGRKIWENILSVSRNLSRMIQLYTNEVGVARKHKIINLIAAYPYLLRHHIRSGCLCANNIKQSVRTENRLLLHEPPSSRNNNNNDCKECWVDRRKLPWRLFDSKQSQELVAKAQNRPLWVCDRIGREIMDIKYCDNFTSRERLTLLGKVEKLTEAIGQCERIHQTAVPLNYARHSLRSLTIWLFTLPFALVKDFGIFTGPATAIVAWLLFGVYQIGYSIEDPFQGSLRLSILCDAIRRNVLDDDMDQGNKLTSFYRDHSAYQLEIQTEDEVETGILQEDILEEKANSFKSLDEVIQLKPRIKVSQSVPTKFDQQFFDSRP